MLSLVLVLAVMLGVARAETSEISALQAHLGEDTPGVASVSDNHASPDMPRTAESDQNVGGETPAPSEVTLASLGDNSASVNPCLSCDGRFYAGRGEIGREFSLLAGEKAPLTIDVGIAGEDSCVQREAVDDCRNGAAGGILKKDWPGIGRDTAYFVGYQLAVIGFLYLLPESVSGWSKEQKQDEGLSEWWDHVKNPKWDKDKWYLNYIAHPYWGAIYYIRARERGFDKFESFVYSALLSTLYEFGVEAIFEPPSLQDLIVTPIGGTLLGMYVFEPVRERIKAKGDQQEWYEKLALVLSDPLGAVSEFTDKLFGIKSSARVTHCSANTQRCRQDDNSNRGARSTACRGSYTGLEVMIQW